jgi:hypothetical protein
VVERESLAEPGFVARALGRARCRAGPLTLRPPEPIASIPTGERIDATESGAARRFVLALSCLVVEFLRQSGHALVPRHPAKVQKKPSRGSTVTGVPTLSCRTRHPVGIHYHLDWPIGAERPCGASDQVNCHGGCVSAKVPNCIVVRAVLKFFCHPPACQPFPRIV